MGLVTGCSGRSGNGSVWDDNSTAGNYKGSARSLWGNEESTGEDFFGPNDEDFIGLKDEDLRTQFADGAIPQPKHSPGEVACGIPGIEAFQTPQGLTHRSLETFSSIPTTISSAEKSTRRSSKRSPNT